MTISEKTTSARNDYIGNGVVTNFSFTFDVLNEANSLTGKNYSLKVLLTTSGTEAEQVEDTDYTVTYDSATRLGSVTFTTVPAKSVLITLLSDVSKTQSTDYINIGTDKFPADSHEKTVDKLTLITRELQEVIDRAILLSESSTISGVTLPVSAANANKAIVVNSAGTDLDAQSLIDLSLYPVTNFAETLLDDTTSTEARTTLDAEQKINSLVAITSLEDADQFIVTDNSDSDNSKKITRANMQATESARGFTILPKRITVANGTDTEHDIDFSAGNANLSDGSGQVLATAETKQMDVSWVVGTGATPSGGLAEGLSIVGDTFYYSFVIMDANNGFVGFGFDSSITAANLLAGANVIAAGGVKYIRIKNGFFETNATLNIKPFKKAGNLHSAFGATGDDNLVSATSNSGGATLTNALPAIPCKALVNLGMQAGLSTFSAWGNLQKTATAAVPATAGATKQGTICTNNGFSASGVVPIIFDDGSIFYRNFSVAGGVSSIEIDLISIEEL